MQADQSHCIDNVQAGQSHCNIDDVQADQRHCSNIDDVQAGQSHCNNVDVRADQSLRCKYMYMFILHSWVLLCHPPPPPPSVPHTVFRSFGSKFALQLNSL